MLNKANRFPSDLRISVSHTDEQRLMKSPSSKCQNTKRGIQERGGPHKSSEVLFYSEGINPVLEDNLGASGSLYAHPLTVRRTEHSNETYIDANKTAIYDRAWINKKEHGKGTYTFSNGDVYTGASIKGKGHGNGTLKTQDGTITYDGEWDNGKGHGKGTCTFPNGGVYTGDWIEGKEHGEGTYRDPDGNTYHGQCRNRLKQGEFHVTKIDGTIYRCEYNNDNLVTPNQ